MEELTDSFGRKINYLRISITDRCNLRCFYCMPKSGIKLINRNEILSYSEIIRTAKIFTELGIKKMRITGGEPLIREGAVNFIENLQKTIAGIDLAITTNGTCLDRQADSLASAGIGGINVSLDSLNKDRYRKITANNVFSPDNIINNIKKALKLGIKDIKINTVLTGLDDENDIYDLINLSLNLQIDVKFIEMMPVTRPNGKGVSEIECGKIIKLKNNIKSNYFSESSGIDKKVLNILKRFGHTEVVSEIKGFGPAVYYRIKNSKASMGVIPNNEKHCENCNRLRLTSEGKLKLCLYSDPVLDIKKLLRNGSTDEEISKEIKKSIKNKPLNKWSGPNAESIRNQASVPEFMNKIGG